jgi:hypothetical protein
MKSVPQYPDEVPSYAKCTLLEDTLEKLNELKVHMDNYINGDNHDLIMKTINKNIMHITVMVYASKTDEGLDGFLAGNKILQN